VRSKIRGSAARPRLSVFRSLRHIYVQLIDDDSGITLGAVSTCSARFKEQYGKPAGTVEAAAALGKILGEMARRLGIEKVVFDRNGYRYHGRVKALAEAARQSGLKF